MIKECPFCGEQAEIRKTDFNMYMVVCKLCSSRTNLYSSEETALRVWNTRKENYDLVDDGK